MTSALLNRKISKSKFSMYLRTLCDKSLYLSLFSNNAEDLAKAGVPVPLKTRPGVQLITKSGKEFEAEQYDYVIANLPGNVFHKANGRAPVDLTEALSKITASTLILQPTIAPESYRNFVLKNLGVDATQFGLIPEFSGLIPDVVFADARQSGESEILPDGTRKALAPEDKRIPLCVIDLKNVTEANASYSAEVCLYAIFLANWLYSVGAQFKDKYFVSDRIYLWRHMELPRLVKIIPTVAGGDHKKRLNAFREDLSDGLVNYLLYMPNVRKFFAEDLPRVISIGDNDGWQKLEYHVNSKCGSCDWLGHRSWLSDDDKVHFDANNDNYCYPRADVTDHLSKMTTLSKGATRVLARGGHDTVAHLTKLAATDAVLKGHSLLKRDRGQIKERALAISSGTASIDTGSKIGGFAKSLNAEYDVVVNFDAGSGFLTGIALRGVVFTPYGKTLTTADGHVVTLLPLGDADFVVAKDNLIAEWAALEAFIDKLATWIEQNESAFQAQNLGKVHTQICFWEIRQYEELCNAFGRHLLKVLGLPAKHQKALAWIFPPAELLEKSEEICPSIVFIKDIVTAHLRLPQKFSATLLGTAEAYQHPKILPRNIDNYYVEPLGNAIPRERIFEIWKSTTGTVRMFGKDVSVIEAVTRYGGALRAHAKAIASIAAQLRLDLKDCLSGKAPALDMAIPTGLSQVAYDSKLWDRWCKVSNAAARTEGEHDLIAKAETLEASYKAIVLTDLVASLGNNRFVFNVSPDSTEAKIEEGAGFLTIGIISWPGFPLQTCNSMGLSAPGKDFLPMHKIIAVDIEEFDRVKCQATIQIRPGWSALQDAFDEVMKAGILPIGTEPIYVLSGLPYDDAKVTTSILSAMGNPVCAVTAPQALSAMGAAAAKKLPAGTAANTRPAQVLWTGDQLAKASIRNSAEVTALASAAEAANPHPLNDSQVAAIKGCAASALSVIWGPPGTGKTNTLVALLQAVIKEDRQKRILISGPNYRTVEVIFERLAQNLSMDATASCNCFLVYSAYRDAKQITAPPAHVNIKSLNLSPSHPDYGDLLDSFANSQSPTIVATTAHAVNKLIEKFTGSDLAISELFDLVILDESSQIPVALALRPLAALKADGQLVVAGDHLQMPPIEKLEPPKGAEYLVGSIQKYLIERFKISPQELLVNYRSNQELVDYAKSIGYPAGLKAFEKAKNLHVIKDIPTIIASLPAGLPKSDAYELLVAPDKQVTALIHDDPISSQANEVEAGMVAALAYIVRHAMAAELDSGQAGAFTAMSDVAFFESGIGIVTPHKAQKALVIRKLTELFPGVDPAKIFESVDTVERFQGGERQVIIVSFGVGDTDIIEGEEGFLLQLERTNVAVSRAKAKCIVLMPATLAYHLPSDQKAADTSVAIKSYLEEFCANRRSTSVELSGTVRNAEVRWH